MTEEEIEQLETFLRVAHTGRNGKASTGERSAFTLSQKVLDLGWLLMDVDEELRCGFFQALRAAAHPDSRVVISGQLPR